MYAEYQQGIEKRKDRLEGIKKQQENAIAVIREKWAAKRKELEGLNIAKKNRRGLIQLARKREAEEIAAVRIPYQAPRETVRREIPFASWSKFLQFKASQGNEIALAVLRSKGKIVEPEKEPQSAPVKDWSQHGKEQFAQHRAEIRAEYAVKERTVLETETISTTAVLRMEQLAADEQLAGKTQDVQGFSATVDRKGTVIFTLPGGGKIQDSGTELFFSGKDAAAHKIAVQYAQKKWGKMLHIEGNRLCRKDMLEQKRGIER